MNFFLGCAVWAYKDWVGHFYPAKTPQRDFLRLYAERLTAVEGNTTFYAIPEEKTVAKWASQTPPTFQFCLKFPREITHNGWLQPAVPQALSFLQIISNLGDRLGPTFAQFPPQLRSRTDRRFDGISNCLTPAKLPPSCGIPPSRLVC